MKKLAALTAVFDAEKNIAKDQFDSWAEDGEIEWNGSKHDITDEGQTYILWDQPYTAVLSFENYTGEATCLFLILMNWLEQNDCERGEDDLGPPAFDVEKVGVNTFDVELKVDFKEKVYGKLTIDNCGKEQYTIIDKPETTIAENVGNVEVELCDDFSLET